jgi:cytoskeletal protein CcmA (bactofilin family)
MSEPSRRPASDPLPCILAPGSQFSGLVVLHGGARIEGCVRGEIVGAEVLEIGESGRVEARVEADEVIVAGALEGELRARRRVVLKATARVRGAIVSPRLAVAEGCVCEGSCRAGEAEGRRAADRAGAADSP